MTHLHRACCLFRLLASYAVYVVPPNYESGELNPMDNSGAAFREWSR